MYRLLYHLTLALAGLCLTIAVAPFLPEAWLVAPVYLLLVGLAWRVEGRWSLPNWAANLVGLLIAASAGWWMTARIDTDEEWVRDIPIAAALVPMFGPLVMALTVVRLFRPRGPADFWAVQGLGVIQVALACVLGSGVSLAAPLLAYVVAGVCTVIAQYRLASAA